MDIHINAAMDRRHTPDHGRATKTKIKSLIEYRTIYKLYTKSIVCPESPKMRPSSSRAQLNHKPDEETAYKRNNHDSKKYTRIQYGSNSCRLNLRKTDNKRPNSSSVSSYSYRGSISNHHKSKNHLINMPSTLIVAIILLASAHLFQSSLMENSGNAASAYDPIMKSGQHELPSSSTKDKHEDSRLIPEKYSTIDHRERDDKKEQSNRPVPSTALSIAANRTSRILSGPDLPDSLNNLAHSNGESTINKPTTALIEPSTSASELSSSDLVPSPNQLDDVALIAADSKKKKKMMKKKKKMEKKHKEWKKGKKHKKKKFEEKKKKGEMSKKKKGKKEKKKWGMEKKGHKKKGNFKKKKWGEKKKMKKGQKKGKKGHKMLKDKGHKKKGFKKIYHKEEWGKKKKWHDIKREKKWNTKQKKWKKKWHQEKGKKYKGKHMKKYHKKNKHGKKYKKEKKEKFKKHKGEKFKKGHKKKKEEYSKKKEGGKKKKEKKMKKEMKKKKG